MLKLIFIIAFASFTSLQALSQHSYKPVQFYLQPSLGSLLTTTQYSPNSVHEYLPDSKFAKFYIQFVGVGFFYKKFGLEGLISLTPVQSPEIGGDQFNHAINAIYESEYYTQISSNTVSGEAADPMFRGSIGPSYKIENDKLLFISRLMIGFTTINTNWRSITLKGRDTNELLYIQWESEYATEDFFTTTPSITLAYRLSRRLMLNMDASTSFYNVNINYKEKTKSADSKTTLIRNHHYHHRRNDISLGIGIMIVLR